MKIRVGPRGGKYYVKRGRKIYLSNKRRSNKRRSNKRSLKKRRMRFGAGDDEGVPKLERRLSSSLGVAILSDSMTLENIKRVFQKNGEFKVSRDPKKPNKYYSIFYDFCKTIINNIINDNNITLDDTQINQVAENAYNNAKSYITNKETFKNNVTGVLGAIVTL